MKKILFMSLITLVLVSCGKDESTTVVVVNPPAVVNKSIQNKFQSSDDHPLHGLETLDFTGVTLGVQAQDSYCDGKLGNSGTVNGVAERHTLMDGTSSEGFLQYGHLGYLPDDAGTSNVANNPELAELCKELSKERYTYKMTGDELELCMVNYPYCSKYKVVVESIVE